MLGDFLAGRHAPPMITSGRVVVWAAFLAREPLDRFVDLYDPGE
jgi:hypothetical protein